MSDSQPKEPADLRAAYDALKAEHTALQSEYTSFKATTTFKEAGLSAKHAELYLAANPDGDISTESVAAFAKEYGLQPAAPAAPPAEAPDAAPAAPPVPSMAGMADAAGSPQAQAGAAAPAKMSKDEFERLLVDNPQAAAQAYAEGRVERNPRNVQADDLVAKGVIR